MRMSSRVVCFFVLITIVRTAAAQLPAGPGDWPGWRGAARDNISKETGLLRAWPKDGPELAWKADGLGLGYSTPSVAKGVVYLLGTEPKSKDKDKKNDRTECVIALSAKDGTRLWSTPFGSMEGGYEGPRSTPTIDGETLYVISSNGILISAKTKSGEINWRKDFKKEFGGRAGGWAYCESPLIDGNVLVCTPGGEAACMVALDKKTGDLLWKSDMTDLPEGGGKKGGGYTRAAYSSPIVATLQGVKQYVQFLHGGVVGVDAKSGKLLWHYEHPANGTANISTPIQFGNAIFASSDYGTGGGLANIVKKDGKLEAEEAYFLKEMRNHHGGMVAVGGYLYGTDGGNLLCVDLKSGKIAWKNKSIGKGSLTYADGHLYVRSERGPIALVQANPKEYKEAGRFEQPLRSGREAWPHPVVAGGKLFIRDQDVLLCFDVRGH
jgi:outer membrane protein assembly factor BamB